MDGLTYISLGGIAMAGFLSYGTVGELKRTLIVVGIVVLTTVGLLMLPIGHPTLEFISNHKVSS